MVPAKAAYDYEDISGTASNGLDFGLLSGEIVIPIDASAANVIIMPVLDDAPEGSEWVTLLLEPDLAYTVGLADSASLTIADRPWDAWRLEHFNPAELANPAISGDQADVDLDRLVNLLEYAHNLEPKSADTTTSFTGALDSSPAGLYYVVSFTRRKAPTDLVYAVEVSSDLVHWQSSPNVAQPLPAIDDGNGVTETARYRIQPAVTDDQFDQRFVRLHITRL